MLSITKVTTSAFLALTLVCAASDPASAAPGRCAKAVSKASDRFFQTRARLVARCADAALRAGDTAGAAACPTAGDTLDGIDAASAAMAAEIARGCGGSDRICGTVDDENLVLAGWDFVNCPDVAGADCDIAIGNCSDIAACLACTGVAAGAAGGDGLLGQMLAEPTALVCQRAIVTNGEKLQRAASNRLRKCWAAVEAGKTSGPCPDAKTQAKREKATRKVAGKICKACGGADRLCDQAAAGLAGSGGADDLAVADVGLPAQCSDLTLAGSGEACMGTIETIADAVECLACGAAFGAECSAAVAAPNATAYPPTCDGPPVGECPGCLLWSNPATWGGAVPGDGELASIPEGTQVLLDVDTANLSGLEILGDLVFARQNLTLTADWIRVHGSLQIGSEIEPFTQQAVIALVGSDPSVNMGMMMGMGMGTRALMMMGTGTVSIHGAPPAVAWTQISDHVGVGETDWSLLENVDWSPGDEIVFAPTDFYTVDPTPTLAVTEKFTVSSVADHQVSTTSGPSIARWGVLQYPTTTGMALAPDDSIVLTPEMEGMPMVLDERAEVGNLTRNVRIEGPDDTLWQTEGYGATVMMMGPGTSAFVEGVEIRRGGQRGNLGRYPFHWHMLSYDPPAELGDAVGQYLRNSVIHESSNRGVVVHGTNGVLVQNNIIYDVRGHAIFTEDASERRNVFDHNLVLHVRNPEPEDALKMHELEFGSPGVAGGSSGFWISNPDNTIINNTAADCGAFGFWLAFTFRTWGASAPTDETRVPLAPQRMALTAFDGNTAHSTYMRGLMLDMVESDNEGRVSLPGTQQQYTPSDSPDGYFDNPGIAYANRVTFELTNFTVWKAGLNGIWDRSSGARNRDIVSADNCQKFFAGSGEDGVIERSLLIGNSLNTPETPRPLDHGDPTPSAFATYHSAFDIRDNVVLNFPLTPGQTSGVFAEDDFYFRPVEKGTFRNSGNIIIDSHPGFKSVAHYSGTGSYQPFASYFNFAPAKWDPWGWAGPAGNYLVYDTPFHTYGLGGDVIPVAPDSVSSGAVSVPGPFYGFTAFVLHGSGDTLPQNQDYNDLMDLHVTRLDAGLSEVATWDVAGVCCSNVLFAHMRDFAAHADGIYEIEFPFTEFNPGWAFAMEHPTDVRMEVENMLTEDDTLVIGVHFDGTIPANVWLASPGNGYVPYTDLGATDPTASVTDVIASAGETYWQDTVNNRVWIKLRGGTWQPGGWEEFVVTPDMLLYETTHLRIAGP